MRLFKKKGISKRELHKARNRLGAVAHLLNDTKSAFKHGLLHGNDFVRASKDPILREFSNRLSRDDFVSRQVKPNDKKEEKPIGEQLEKQHAKEKEEFKEDLKETGTMNMSQITSSGALGKIKNMFHKKKKAPPAGVDAQQVQRPAPAKKGGVDPAKLSKIQMTVEKMNAKLFALKDKNEYLGDRLQKVTEDVGEIRSMQFQRDKEFDDVRGAAEKAKQVTDILDPNRIEKVLQQRKKEIERLSDKFDRAEELSEQSQKQIDRIKDSIHQITSIKNLLKQTKHLAKVAREVKKLKSEAKSYAEQAQAAFMEIQNISTDMSSLRAKIETNNETTKTNVREVGSIKLKMENLAGKDGLNKLRETVNKLTRYEDKFYEIEDNLSELKKQVGNILAVKAPEQANIEIQNKESEIAALQEQKKQIRFFLEDLKSDYWNHLITESAYSEAKQINENRLNEIEKKISMLSVEKQKQLETTKLRKKKKLEIQGASAPKASAPKSEKTKSEKSGFGKGLFGNRSGNKEGEKEQSKSKDESDSSQEGEEVKEGSKGKDDSKELDELGKGEKSSQEKKGEKQEEAQSKSKELEKEGKKTEAEQSKSDGGDDLDDLDLDLDKEKGDKSGSKEGLEKGGEKEKGDKSESKKGSEKRGEKKTEVEESGKEVKSKKKGESDGDGDDEDLDSLLGDVGVETGKKSDEEGGDEESAQKETKKNESSGDNELDGLDDLDLDKEKGDKSESKEGLEKGGEKEEGDKSESKEGSEKGGEKQVSGSDKDVEKEGTKEKSEAGDSEEEGSEEKVSGSVSKLKKKRSKFNRYLEQVKRQYEEDLLSEKEYYKVENRVMSKIRKLNKSISEGLENDE